MKQNRELPIGISPRLLTRAQAAAYCQVSVATFMMRCPVAPIKMGHSAKMLRWDVRKLDEWLDVSIEPPLAEKWLDRLEDGNAGHRSRRKTV